LIELAASETLTAETGTGVTVISDVALFPSLNAVIVALPDVTAVTSPVDDTVATEVLFEDHVTSLPVSALFPASRMSGDSCRVPPTTTLAADGATVTDATGIGVTVTVATPLVPSLVAVISAVPGPTAVRTPSDDTVAIAGAPEDHAIARPSRTFPARSLSTAAA
jgi:hypothetical protein